MRHSAVAYTQTMMTSEDQAIRDVALSIAKRFGRKAIGKSMWLTVAEHAVDVVVPTLHKQLESEWLAHRKLYERIAELEERIIVLECQLSWSEPSR